MLPCLNHKIKITTDHHTIILNSFVYLFVSPVTSSRRLGLKGSNVQGLMEVMLV